MADNDEDRALFHLASGLSTLLKYDFAKLVVIESKNPKAKDMERIAAALPDREPGVAEARRALDAQWLLRIPGILGFSEGVIIRRTDAHLAAVLPGGLPSKQRANLVVAEFLKAALFGRPPSDRTAIEARQTYMFKQAATVTELTGLPFADVGKVQAHSNPGAIFNLVRSLPADLPGRDEALKAVAGSIWTYPPK